MQKVEAQRSQAPLQAALRQGGGATFESPQGDQIAQLEAMVEASPQVAGLARYAAMANGSPQAAAQRRTLDMIGNSPRMAVQRKAAEAMHNSPNIAAQRQRLDTLSGEIAQRKETEEPLQPKVAQREEAPAKPNNTGLPDNLKSGIESLSGMSMDSVRVHYNSSQPAQLNALAYAQGTDIHVGPGQERHLPHEAWHVVQQAQGRVRPTMQMKGAAINDDAGLEAEADVMGGRAVSIAVVQGKPKGTGPMDLSRGLQMAGSRLNNTTLRPIQRVVTKSGEIWISDRCPGQEFKTEEGAIKADRLAGGDGRLADEKLSSGSSSSSLSSSPFNSLFSSSSSSSSSSSFSSTIPAPQSDEKERQLPFGKRKHDPKPSELKELVNSNPPEIGKKIKSHMVFLMGLIEKKWTHLSIWEQEDIYRQIYSLVEVLHYSKNSNTQINWSLGGKLNSKIGVHDHIRSVLPQNGHGNISGALNDMELGRGKATTNYPRTLHASAGKVGAKGGCTLFFKRDESGNVDLVGVGQHTDPTSYAIFWNSIGMPNKITL